MEDFAKWILINDEIRMSHCIYHKDLLKDGEDRCDGGGLVTVDDESKQILFYGESLDFGKADKVMFNLAVTNHLYDIKNTCYFLFEKDVDDYTIKFI